MLSERSNKGIGTLIFPPPKEQAIKRLTGEARVPYRLPAAKVIEVTSAVVLGRRRSIARDAQWLVAHMPHPPVVLGAENIPSKGSLLITLNHHSAPGADSWWGPAVIQSVLAQRRTQGERDVHWIMTNQWSYEDALRSLLITPTTRWLFTRMAACYDGIPMPPMPPRSREIHERAQAVRRALSITQRGGGIMIGLAPEGRDSADGALTDPPPGTGRFIVRMCQHGLQILPVGVYLSDGILTVQFGEPYVLHPPPDISKEELDCWARDRVMTAIARLLPEQLRGRYASLVEETF